MTTPSGTEAAVCADIAARQQRGILKYGTTVADNALDLREWLQHAYEECLDMAVYLKRTMEELDKEKTEYNRPTEVCPYCRGSGQYLDSEGMPQICEECSECCANCKWAQEKEDRYDQVRCCCNESPNAWGDVEASDSCSYFMLKREELDK